MTLEPAEDGVNGSHGASVQHPVGEESLNVLDSVVLWAEVQTPVLGTQVRRRIVMMDHVSSGVAGSSGASALLLVDRESSRGREVVSQGNIKLTLARSNFSYQEWKLYRRRQPGRRMYGRIRTLSRLELMGIMDWVFYNLWGRNTD